MYQKFQKRDLAIYKDSTCISRLCLEQNQLLSDCSFGMKEISKDMHSVFNQYIVHGSVVWHSVKCIQGIGMNNELESS